MSIHFWLYVSRSTTVPEADASAVISEIVRVAQEKNAELGVTGALVYCDMHFGQIIEGPPASIMSLRSSILSDPRHTNIKTIADGKAARRFGDWALAFAGPSMVISRALQGAIRDVSHGKAEAGETLIGLMQEALST